MKIYVKKIENVILPQKGTEVSAGYDIVATSEPKIVGSPSSHPNTWWSIDYIEYETNLFIAPEAKTFHTLIYPRSSISKYNLVLANSIALIDNDYRGEILLRFKYIFQPGEFIFTWEEDSSRIVKLNGGVVTPGKIYKKGDKIAQLVITPTIQAEYMLVDDLSQTQRGEGGFGSTDVKHTQEQVTDHKTSPSPILDLYRSSHIDETTHKVENPNYEQLIKEREKRIS